MKLSKSIYYLEKFIFYHPIAFTVVCLILLASIPSVYETRSNEMKAHQVTHSIKELFLEANLLPINEIQPIVGETCTSGLKPVFMKLWPNSKQSESGGNPSAPIELLETRAGLSEQMPEPGINVWRGNIFCISRLTKITFKNKHEKCPVYTQPCSSIYCTEPNEPCPITSLSVVKDSFTLQNKYYESVGLDNEYKLIFSRSENFSAITKLSVALSHLPCLNQSLQDLNLAPSFDSEEVLSGCNDSGSTIDAIFVDKEALSRIYIDNPSSQNSLNTVAKNSSSSNTYGYMIANAPLRLNKAIYNCHPGTFKEKYPELLLFSLNDYNDYLQTISWIIYVIMLLCLFMAGFIIYNEKNCSYDDRAMNIARVLQLILYVLLIIALIFQANYNNVGGEMDFRPLVSYFKELENGKCFKEKEHEGILAEYNEFLRQNLSLVHNVNVLFMVLAIMSGLITVASIYLKHHLNGLLEQQYHESTPTLQSPVVYIELIEERIRNRSTYTKKSVRTRLYNEDDSVDNESVANTRRNQEVMVDAFVRR